EEGDGPRAAGVPACQFQSGFQRFGATVGEEDALGRLAGRQFREALRQVDLRTVVKIGSRHVQELRCLVLNGGDDVRVAVPRRGDGDAGREIEEQVSVHVFDDRAAAAFDYERIDARVRRRRVPLVALQQDRGEGTGQVRANVRDRAIIEEP